MNIEEIKLEMVIDGKRTAIIFVRREKLESLLNEKSPTGEWLLAMAIGMSAPLGPKS